VSVHVKQHYVIIFVSYFRNIRDLLWILIVVHPLIKLSRTVTDSLSVNSHNAIESDLSEIMLAHDIEKKMITMSVLFNILVNAT
jgi:hypothetical protein